VDKPRENRFDKSRDACDIALPPAPLIDEGLVYGQRRTATAITPIAMAILTCRSWAIRTNRVLTKAPGKVNRVPAGLVRKEEVADENLT
jgi:hypothetical protein